MVLVEQLGDNSRYTGGTCSMLPHKLQALVYDIVPESDAWSVASIGYFSVDFFFHLLVVVVVVVLLLLFCFVLVCVCVCVCVVVFVVVVGL